MTCWRLRLIGQLALGCAIVTLLALAGGRGLPLEAQIAYAARFGTAKTFNLYLLSVPRQLVIPLTRDSGNNIAPEWSPDGERLAFVSDRDGTYRIYLADLQGSRHYPLTDVVINKNRPLWSPDGNAILFVSLQTGYPQLMLIDPRTQTTHTLTTDRRPYLAPNWSPDSQQVMFISDTNETGNRNIFSLDVNSGGVHSYLATSGHDLSLSWSPDGRYLLYTLDQLPPSIYLWDTHEQEFYPLDTPVSPNSVPDWSPDGRMIVYTAFISGGDMGIYELNAATCIQSTQTCIPNLLTPRPGVYASPQWRPLRS